jgi:hypothetical protein
MGPLFKAFYTFKYLLSNLKVEVILDDFIMEEDPFNADLITELSADERFLTERRYDVRINGMYHKIFYGDLGNAFNEFNWEIKYNLKKGSLINNISSYFEKLEEELTILSDNITEHETKLNSQLKWLYLPKNIDKSFLNSEGLNDSIIENISSIFLFIKNNIIEIIESIKKFEDPNFAEKGIDIPEEMFSNVIIPTTSTGILDIYQTALLFYYLKKYKAIIPLTYTSLAKLVGALTGHSEQNIRTEKGFGAIADIFADRVKNQNFKDQPNYNLLILKEFMMKIIDDIELQMKKNYPDQEKK